MRKSWILIFLITGITSLAHAGWTPAVRISDEATAYGPRIVANGDTLHVVYWIWTGHAECYYLRSIDEGVSWASPFYLSDTLISSGEGSPEIYAYGDTVVAIWYQDITGGGGVNLGFRKSVDGGGVWNDLSLVLPTDNYMLQKHTFSIGGGSIYLIYSRWAQEIIVEFTKSTNWGETWIEPTEVFRTEQTGPFDMRAVGDTIHLVWVGRFDYDHRWEIYYMRSTDAGVNWSENAILSTPDDRGSNWPTISINSMGHIAVCWMDYKYSPYFITGDIFIRYSYDGGESWTEEEQLTSHHLVFPVRVLWRGDSIHVVWEDWRNEQPDIYYNCSTDNGATWEDEQRVEDDPGSSEIPDLEIAGGNIHLVWADFGQTSGSGIYYSRWEEEVGIQDDAYELLPHEPGLSAYPNPFNSFTAITYNDLEGGEIEIYSIMGQKIRTLIAKPKEGKVTWDARDALGNKVSSGIYFARVRNGSVGTRAPQNSNTIKLIYLK